VIDNLSLYSDIGKTFMIEARFSKTESKNYISIQNDCIVLHLASTLLLQVNRQVSFDIHLSGIIMCCDKLLYFQQSWKHVRTEKQSRNSVRRAYLTISFSFIINNYKK
jgi:hypothetical protein